MGLGNKEANHHFWWQKDGGCSRLWPSPPPVKTWLSWPQLSYRLSAQPLIPLSGTRGSRNFAITVCLHLLCARLYFLVCDRLQATAFSCLSASLLFFKVVSLSICLCLFDRPPPLIISSFFCLHTSYSLSLSTLSPLLSAVSSSPRLSLCPRLCHLFLSSLSVPLYFPISLPTSPLAV